MALTTSTGATVADTTISALRDQLRGRLIVSDDPEYPRAKSIWNSYFEQNPGAIARCTGSADVALAVRFAAENGIDLAVRGGGHCFAGTGSCEGGLVIDTSLLKGIQVHPAKRTVVAQPGLLQGEFDAETQAFGLAVTGSQESYIGIGGLTLGGGLGWLARYRGLLADNLLTADIVLASGEVRTASPEDDAELFWAIRGGGGNFGVATSFTYKLYPQGPCLAGLLAFPISETVAVTRALDEYNATAPDALTTSFAFLTTPEGERAVGLGFVHADPGPDTEAQVVAPLRGLGKKLLMDICGVMPYLDVQQMLDHNTVAGHRYYPRSFLLPELREEALQILADGFATTPSSRTLIGGGLMGGVMAKSPASTTPFPHRTGYLTSILSAWVDPAEDTENVAWTEKVYGELVRYTTGAVYANHLGSDSKERIVDAYGSNYDRLVDLKTVYDPANLFHVNHNIKPRG
jgi:FAD/FMN-containing dehydrogenase